jgi:hypothetical protein
MSEVDNRLGKLELEIQENRKSIFKLTKRVARLEYETGVIDIESEDELYTPEEPDVDTLEQRIHKLETTSSISALGVESELSELERILCGLEEEPSSQEASRHRAVALAKLWPLVSDEVGDREVSNVERHRLKTKLSEELDDDISSKQLKRAMEAFVDMMAVGDTKKARLQLGTNNANQLIIDHPEDVVWTAEALREQLAEE